MVLPEGKVMFRDNRRIEVDLPLELESILTSVEYEENGRLIKKSLTFLGDKLLFDFELHLGKVEEKPQLWQMVIGGYKTSRIYPEQLGSYFQFYDYHFLLFEFQNIQTELYTTKLSVDPVALLADLYSTHQKSFGNFLSLDKYLNKEVNLPDLGCFGLFARGPKKILEVYFDCLHRSGAKPYFYGQYNPDVENSDLKLLIIGQCYFIGNEFHFRRVEAE